MGDIFSVPVCDQVLVYAPLHRLTALVDSRAAVQLGAALRGSALVSGTLHTLADALVEPAARPAPRSGPLERPLFLGLIPTRGCNMACRYCGFPAPSGGPDEMPLETARLAVDAYLRLTRQSGLGQADIQFFGGEPFAAPRVIDFSAVFARQRAAELGIDLRLEATTNGLFSAERARWIAAHFDAIVLSLDGPPEIQDRQRPGKHGGEASAVVMRSARILSQGSLELVLRACVTAESVASLASSAAWFAEEFGPTAVCFEVLVPSPLSRAAGMSPPDPYQFAHEFNRASGILEAAGIEAVCSTGRTGLPQASFCPLGKDALIVSPDGSVDACYLEPEEWRQAGLDLSLGRLDPHGSDPLAQLGIDPRRLAAVRALSGAVRPRCTGCFCRYDCAGGCHVHHGGHTEGYDDVCIQTRLISAARLVRQAGFPDLAAALLADPRAAALVACQEDDRLVPEEAACLAS